MNDQPSRQLADSFRLSYVAYSPLDLASANSLQTYNTVRELSKRLGARLTTIVPRFGNEPLPPFPVKRLARIPVNKLSRLVNSAWYSYIERTLYAERARRILQTGKPDLIYTRDSVCAYRLVKAGLPILYEVHDLESEHAGQFRSARLTEWLIHLDEQTLCGARGVASLTETFRREIIARGWQPASNVFAIPDAYDDAVYFPRAKMEMRATLNLPLDSQLVMYAGLTFKYRGLDILLQAFKRWNDPNARLVLIGGRSFEVQELQTRARDLNLKSQVEFVGRQPPDLIARYLAASDVLVIPDTVTDATASPLKMFEYMAMARPIVCLDRASLREILGDSAYYFPRGDLDALAASLQQAMQPAAQALGEQGHKRVQEYTYAKRAEKIIRAVRSILSSVE